MAAKKLCELVKKGLLKDDPQAYAELIRQAKYMCKRCGRSAVKSKCLCKPAKL